MNGLVKFFILSSSLLASQVVNAAPPSGKLSGMTVVSKTFSFYCEMEIDINGNLADFTITGGDGFCFYTSFNGGPYTMTQNGSSITFHNVAMTTYAAGDGKCYGDLVAEWDGTYLDFIDAVLPYETNSPDCIISGFFY